APSAALGVAALPASRYAPPVTVSSDDPATTEIYTLSLHDALPIWVIGRQPGFGHQRLKGGGGGMVGCVAARGLGHAQRIEGAQEDRKSTRLNSSHVKISYAVFCLKKKKRQGAGTGSAYLLPADSGR